MTHYDIFRDQLALKYPSFGHALWEPTPVESSYPCVEVGDVGYIQQGRFHRLFNALLPTNDSSNNLGAPVSHVPLLVNHPRHIFHGTLSPGYYCSAGVTVEARPTFELSRPDDYPEVSFSCTRKQGGAVLFIPVSANRQDTLARKDFAAWIQRHIDRCFEFSLQFGIEIGGMQNIVFVTGRDCVRSWMNVAFFGGEKVRDARVSFGSNVDSRVSGVQWRALPENVRGAVLSQGPEGMNLPQNQCIFIRGFRVVRTLWFLPRRLGAAAEFSSDPDKDDEDEDTEPISVSLATKPRDPLHLLLDYVAARVIGCDMGRVHDDDLAGIDGIFDGDSLESLRPNILMGHLRGSNRNIYQVEYGELFTSIASFLLLTEASPEDLLSTKTCSDTVGGIVKVAPLSVLLHNQDHMSQSPLPSLALQSSDMTEAYYKRQRQIFHHCLTLVLPSLCSVSCLVNRRHSTAGSTTTSGWKSRGDVHHDTGLLQGSTVASFL